MKKLIDIWDSFFISFVVTSILVSLFSMSNKISPDSNSSLFLLSTMTIGLTGTVHRLRFPEK